MDNAGVTAQIMEAWSEIQEEETAQTDEQPEGEPSEEVELNQEEDETEEPEEEEPEEDEDEDEDEEEDDEDEGDEEGDSEPAVAFESDDLEVRAYLAKYGGDVNEALRGAAGLYHVVGRQGAERNAALERVAELEAELQQARAFNNFGSVLNEEQREWIETATGSGNPAGYVNEALRAGEYGLARALVQEWAREDPYSALRAGQFIDQTEQEVASYVEPVDMGRLLEALKTEIPELPNYSTQMVSVLATLGENHPLVQDARSADVAAAARGIVGIYEIARASSVTMKNARDGVRRQQRENGNIARGKAVVSSASASPSRGEIPRTRMIGPGLSLEQLEAEFARQ